MMRRLLGAMRLPPERWLGAVFLATALVFAGVAVYLYAFRFFDWLESDAAVTALLAARALEAKTPIVADWYYANGDIWGLAPHLLAILPVALLGPGPASLLAAVVLGFVLELAAFVKLYLRLCGELWLAVLAAMATLMAWSNAHAAYAYIQLAYGWLTCLYMLAFTAFATVAEAAALRRRRLAAAGVLVALIALQNPTRALVYVVAPLAAGCLWPWRGVARRRRIEIAAAAAAGWVLAYAAYTWLLAPAVALSVPRGHLEFAIGGIARIRANVAMLGRGLAVLCSDGVELTARAAAGLLLLAGALVLVCREVFASRALTALRFVGVVVLAQLGAVLVPLLVGTLLYDPESIRYLMPSLLAVLGLAAVIAVRTLREAARGWARRLAIGWLVALPLAALAAIPNVRPPAPRTYLWPDAAELSAVADELVRRELSHGFALHLVANLLTLDTDGRARTCPVSFRNLVMPRRWLADTACFAAGALPERFFVVADQTDEVRQAIRATLPPELERFSVGDTYEVYVFRTAASPLDWLELPVLDGELATFPLRFPATHRQLVRDRAAAEAGELVATGEPGTVLFGPYIALPRGSYEASWLGGGVGRGGRITFAARAGSRDLAPPVVVEAADLARRHGELVRLSFTLKRARTDIEFPIESAGGGRVSLHELVIERKR